MITKTLQPPSSLFLLILFLTQIPTSSQSNDVAVYWGQNGITNEANLTQTCASAKYSFVIISFLSGFGNFSTPLLNLTTHCGGDPSSSCTQLASQITYCQKQGIKVILSIGGGFGTYNLTSPQDALNLSDYLWNNFLYRNSSSSSSSSQSRPLGGSILDGIDFAIEESTPYLKDLARDLKSHPNVYLSASPQCLFPDSILASALDTGLFDYVFVKFYNNPSCEFSQANPNPFVNIWNQWVTSLKKAEIFLGLPASPAASSSGYVSPDLFVSQVLPVVNNSPNYGGLALWTRYYDEVSGFSTAIEISAMCTQQSDPKCKRSSHDDDDGFEQRFGSMSIDGFKVVYDGGNLGVQCCEMMCRKNCSCEAYAAVNEANKTGCQIWGKGSKFVEGHGGKGQAIYVVKHRANRWWIWLITGIGAVLAIPLICYFCVSFWRKHKEKVERKMRQKKILLEIGGNAMLSMAKKFERHGKTSNDVEIFSFQSIVAATDNFSNANKLGEGGFGPVYKGTLTDGQVVAIKRLSKSSGQGLIEFKNEAKLMAKLQHTNLVRLLGFCIQRDERILVYEYMPNKSLDFYLFDVSGTYALDWEKRFDIIKGIAQGLLYLHKYSRLKVIHRDLKASNILLDEDLNPKISDFGMARIFGLGEFEENTNRVVGTYGYMSPEYAMNGIVSIKTDVFSFGVLLLEILSSKKNNSRYDLDHHPLNLIGYAWRLWNEGRALELINSTTLNEANTQNKVVRSIHIGLLCVQDHAYDRPSMEDVVSFLSNDTIKLSQPKQPAFFISVIMGDSGLTDSMQETCSINDITISATNGR